MELSCPIEASVSVLFAAAFDIYCLVSLLYVGTHFSQFTCLVLR